MISRVNRETTLGNDMRRFAVRSVLFFAVGLGIFTFGIAPLERAMEPRTAEAAPVVYPMCITNDATSNTVLVRLNVYWATAGGVTPQFITGVNLPPGGTKVVNFIAPNGATGFADVYGIFVAPCQPYVHYAVNVPVTATLNFVGVQ